MGVLPTPNGHVNLDTTTYSLECQPGGFQSFLQNGLTSYPATHSNPITERASSSSKGKTVIDIDDGEEVRKEKRLSWTPDEDVRLVSAWLFHSNDPINGNGKKNDHYWGDVHADYNNTTPPNRKRKVKHLRDRFPSKN
ncbi:hypothetical protein C2845_PM17G07300 [Panicum miliaceum]|uniref:Myb-like domain-containing protein n=1 Tax=Panicum miliaceum TaxID=4540 RepID=A0A3L6Q4C9_PANMI|nr:hypothetical protein C2845_PM17G07300 [Panicum miliaceum]